MPSDKRPKDTAAQVDARLKNYANASLFDIAYLVPRSPITIKGGGVPSLFDLIPQAVDQKRAAEIEDAFSRHFGASPLGALVGFGGTKCAEEDWDYSTCKYDGLKRFVDVRDITVPGWLADVMKSMPAGLDVKFEGGNRALVSHSEGCVCHDELTPAGTCAIRASIGCEWWMRQSCRDSVGPHEYISKQITFNYTDANNKPQSAKMASVFYNRAFVSNYYLLTRAKTPSTAR